MRLIVAAVGRLKDAERDLCERYQKRFDAAGRALGLGPLSICELSESRAASAVARKAEEAARLLKAAGAGKRARRPRRRRESIGERSLRQMVGANARWWMQGVGLPHRRTRRARPGGGPGRCPQAVARRHDAAAWPGARRSHRAALPRHHDPLRPPLPPRLIACIAWRSLGATTSSSGSPLECAK